MSPPIVVPPTVIEPSVFERVRASVLRGALRGALALPDGLLPFGPPPNNTRGTPIDPQIWRMIRMEERVLGGITRGSPAAARVHMRRSVAIVARPSPGAVEVHDAVVPGGPPVRIYRPPGPPRPVFVYLHGGGWVQGDLDTHDALCRRLAIEGERLVVAVHYRLAPEHPFPAGLDDSLAAVRWATATAATLGGRSDGLAVGGDSAGGNLTAALCIALRESGTQLPALQVLIYPAVDQRRGHASHREFAEGFLLTRADIDWYQGHYAADPLDPLASPLLAASFAGLPPAIVTTAGFDPLRDEGEAYADALRGAGVAVTHLDEAGLVHGYAQMDGVIAEADAAVGRLTRALRAAAPLQTGPT